MSTVMAPINIQVSRSKVKVKGQAYSRYVGEGGISISQTYIYISLWIFKSQVFLWSGSKLIYKFPLIFWVFFIMPTWEKCSLWKGYVYIQCCPWFNMSTTLKLPRYTGILQIAKKDLVKKCSFFWSLLLEIPDKEILWCMVDEMMLKHW